MDLFAPCRSCLQCLPFLHVSPPSSPRLTAAAPSSSPHSPEASKAASIDPSQSSDVLPSSNAAPIVQEQDLRLPRKVEEPQASKCDEGEALEKIDDVYSTATESEAVPISGIVIAPPVSSVSSSPPPEDPEDDKITTLPDLPLQVPFINDITFAASGLLPLESPITPAPFGAGYPQGQYPPPEQIYQDQHVGHAHSHHGHENSQHGHKIEDDESSQHEDVNSHHGHNHSHHGHTNSHDGHLHEHSHVHAAPDYEVPPSHPPLDNSQVIHELRKDGSHRHSHHHSHDYLTVDDAEKSVTGHTSLKDDGHDQVDDISPTLPLETSQSTPADLDLEAKAGVEASAVGHTNGASALLETYHSQPVVLEGDRHDDDNEELDEVLGQSGSHSAPRRRRRDHFRNQFKGIKQQIKQGGHHLKEEGSKHMQTIIENMNKQAQQIEQSGSFFMVPRANNN